ncbi:MAG TPA: DUF4157 domain-containing protein, partial [Kofleriaceae bacterium]|nr:DUF4157 domain-containing protein [Kofleriaceae bacterium]
MGRDYQQGGKGPASGSQSLISGGDSAGAGPGKRTLVEQSFSGADVQRKETGAAPAGDVHEAAQRGTAGSGSAMPHLDAIQRSFGSHDVTGVQAHTDGAAQQASKDMGAQAFATGNHVAFGGATDLHTAAHEAAHVVQQRAGVQLKGGVGAAGYAYEQHADAVADKVVAGQSAEGLLAQMAGPSAGGGHGVQRKEVETDAEIQGV